MTSRRELEDAFASAFCKHFCQNHCRANESNDQCWCTEAGIIAAEAVAAASPPLPLPLISTCPIGYGGIRLVVNRP